MPTPIKWIGSVHRLKGRQGFRPEAVVVHIMEGTLVGTDAWFNDPVSKVSAHYGIGKNGQIHQYVLETDVAYHAGRRSKTPAWTGIKARVNPNLYTIGIEHEGDENSPWPDQMYAASAELIRDICTRWSIPIDAEHIVCHRDIYGAKTCPGKVVDIKKLIQMAAGGALTPAPYNFVKKAGKVRTRTSLNVRQGAPNPSAPKARTVKAGEELSYVGWTSNGFSVSSNAHWYKDADGNYFWAGGTETPIPGV